MKDIVIYCPGDVHKKPRHHAHLKRDVVIKKILMIFSENAVGEFKVQCTDSRCGRSGTNRGWYDVDIKDINNYKVTPIQKLNFDLKQASIVVMGGN